MNKRLGFFTVLTLLFSGCASLEPMSCQSTDWHQLGQKRALSGHQKDDKQIEVGCAPKRQIAYSKGYEKGLRRYCSYKSGLHQGRKNGRYQGICNEKHEPRFLRGYYKGQRQRVLTQKKQVTTQLRKISKELEKTERRYARLKSDIFNGNNDFAPLVRQMSELRERRGKLETALSRLNDLHQKMAHQKAN